MLSNAKIAFLIERFQQIFISLHYKNNKKKILQIQRNSQLHIHLNLCFWCCLCNAKFIFLHFFVRWVSFTNFLVTACFWCATWKTHRLILIYAVGSYQWWEKKTIFILDAAVALHEFLLWMVPHPSVADISKMLHRNCIFLISTRPGCMNKPTVRYAIRSFSVMNKKAFFMCLHSLLKLRELNITCIPYDLSFVEKKMSWILGIVQRCTKTHSVEKVNIHLLQYLCVSRGILAVNHNQHWHRHLMHLVLIHPKDYATCIWWTLFTFRVFFNWVRDKNISGKQKWKVIANENHVKKAQFTTIFEWRQQIKIAQTFGKYF